MNNKHLQKKLFFSEYEKTYDEAKIILLGVPLDSNSSFRPGARFAPEEMRMVFSSLEDYSPLTEKELKEVSFYDAGDIVPAGDSQESLNQLKSIINKIVADKKKPLVIGGDHSITPSVVEAFLENGYSNLTVLHFDAHLDLRPDYLGNKSSHACAIYRIIEAGVGSVYQFGIRSGTKEEFALAEKKTLLYPGHVLGPLKKAVELLKDNPVYVTMDIDVVDPCFAPGTGTPEPGGISSAILLKAFPLLKGLNIVGFDIVEVNPLCDNSRITVILGAKLMREALLVL